MKGESYRMSADIWSLGAVVSFLARRGVHLFNNDFSVHNWPRGKHSMKKVQIKITITFATSKLFLNLQFIVTKPNENIEADFAC